MCGKTNILVNQESRESYGNKAAEVATVILKGENEFDGADDKFEEACAEKNMFDTSHAKESATRAHSQREGNLARHVTGKEN